MSNHKMQFPFHISKSWFSVCIFIFLLTVCVGLAIHVTSEEDAICSDSDHSEVPIVSNENVSEKSGSDIEHAKNYVPTEEDVLAARQQATEGMSQQQIENLTEVVKTANLWLEHKYMNGDFFEQLSRHLCHPLSLTLEIFALRVKDASEYCLCCTGKFLRALLSFVLEHIFYTAILARHQ